MAQCVLVYCTLRGLILKKGDSLLKTRTEKFEANVQYNDWIGTTALDDADMSGIRQMFKGIVNGEHLLGVDAYCTPSMDPKRPIEVYVTVYTGLVELDKFGDRASKAYPIVKEYKKEMSLEEFSRLFKRIRLTFSAKNILETGKVKVQE